MITLNLSSKTILVDDITQFIFTSHQKVHRNAGQYCLLFAPNGESRALSIASAPYESTIEFITHVSPSSYKQSLAQLQPGDDVLMTEPTGDFEWPDAVQNPLLMAGGIGISPFRSMWRDRLHRNLSLNTDLYYYARDGHFVHTQELDLLRSKHPEFKVHYVVSNLTERGNIKEVETRPDRLVLMSGVYSQESTPEFVQPNFQTALQREAFAVAEAATKLVS